MKANEAPERLYLSQERDGDRCYVDLMWHKHPYENMENVEYIRKEAFVEKACEWLKEQDEMVGVSFQEDFLERFQNHMKEE